MEYLGQIGVAGLDQYDVLLGELLTREGEHHRVTVETDELAIRGNLRGEPGTMPASPDRAIDDGQARSEIEMIEDFVEENGEVDGDCHRRAPGVSRGVTAERIVFGKEERTGMLAPRMSSSGVAIRLTA